MAFEVPASAVPIHTVLVEELSEQIQIMNSLILKAEELVSEAKASTLKIQKDIDKIVLKYHHIPAEVPLKYIIFKNLA